MPVQVPNYTDFYSSEYHATNVGRMFRPDSPLMPNWKHMPIAYHGRASSIGISPMQVRRPKGQIKPPDAEAPIFAPTRQLDYELEMAFIVGQPNPIGEPVAIDQAEDHIFGMVIFNDWSARDLQAWEYQPLGPFGAKNFASTISPWVVTMAALEPFRTTSPVQQPQILPYLTPHRGDLHLDIELEVGIKAEGDTDYTTVGKSNHRHLYWSQAQQVAHHTITGCNLQIGDIGASGTISGPTPDSLGCLLEATQRGQNPLALASGQTRTFLQNGDTVQMRAWAQKDDVRVGFGSCQGTVVE